MPEGLLVPDAVTTCSLHSSVGDGQKIRTAWIHQMTACCHKWYEEENSRNKREGLRLGQGRPLRRGPRAGALKQAKAGLAELGRGGFQVEGKCVQRPWGRNGFGCSRMEGEALWLGLVRDKRVVRVKARKAGRDLTVRTWSWV